ncbi:MAG: DUF2007 domain-containing protein [Ferruginibacter sp.]
MQTVTVKTFDNYFSANIILTRLQDAGIGCYLKDEYTVTIDPIISNAIGGIKLDVDVRDAEKAQDMLRSFHEDYMRAATCPQCGKHEIIEVPSQAPKNIITAILTWVFSSYSVSAEYIYECQHCRYQSKTLPFNTEQLN